MSNSEENNLDNDQDSSICSPSPCGSLEFESPFPSRSPSPSESRSAVGGSRSEFASGSRSPSRNRSTSSNSVLARKLAEMFGEDEEKREESDDEEIDSGTDSDDGPKKKFGKCSGFILDEAEVDDEEVEEEEWGDEAGIVTNDEEEVGPTAQDIEGHRRVTNLWNGQEDHEIEEYLRKRYAQEGAVIQLGDGGEEMSDEIIQQALLPSVKDPNLWMVKCRIGEEKATCLLLMRKFLTYQNTDKALQIKSVTASENVKGYIYIEAYKNPQVKTAIDDVSNLARGKWKQDMLSVKEMPDVFKVVEKESWIKPKQWVRLKFGLYKGDLAQVDQYYKSRNKVVLRIIPRIDYTHLKSQSLKRKKRPAAKLFDPQAISAGGGEVTASGDFWLFKGNKYSRRGFLHKISAITSIIVNGVTPTLGELERFGVIPEKVDLDLNRDFRFAVDDNVEVIHGVMKNLLGKIVHLDKVTVTIKPQHDDLKDPMIFQAKDLKKLFRLGDHVKVLAGRYEGETGLIIQANDHNVTLLSDLTMEELEVLSNDLRLCSVMASGVDSLGKFEMGDLVNASNDIAGVIVKMERETFHVLTTQGRVDQFRPASLQKRKLFVVTAAFDAYRNTLHRSDSVKVIEGPYTGLTGVIRHIYRNMVYLYSIECIENGGIFVCKAKHLEMAGASKVLPVHNTHIGMELMSPIRSSPMHIPSAGESFGQERDRARESKEGDIIGLTIKIIRGPYKGNIGLVKDASAGTTRIELYTSGQIITVARTNIMNIHNAKESRLSRSLTPIYPMGMTPLYEDSVRTPMANYGFGTPLYDSSMTPMQEGSRTSSVAFEWGPTLLNELPPRTPNEYFDLLGNVNDGSFTSYDDTSDTSSQKR